MTRGVGWSRRKRSGGQTTVEYLLTTLTLVTVFAGMHGFLQQSLRKLFEAAAVKILLSYY